MMRDNERYASIDIGTNSVRLLLAEIKNDQIMRSDKMIETTRLGQDVSKTGVLREENMNHTAEAVQRFVGKAREYQAGNIFVMATSAVRDALNRDIFIQKIQLIAGVEVELLSGEVEAKIGYLGVLCGLEDKNMSTLTLDIGGGSTEYIYGANDQIQFSTSLDIGAVRLTDLYLKSDPPKKEEIANILAHIKNEFKKIGKNFENHSFDKAIGIGGTISSYGSMALKMAEFNAEKIHNYRLTQSDINACTQNLCVLNRAQRKSLIGLEEKRADIIIAGGIILSESMKTLKIKEIFISDYDNLEGYLYYKSKLT